MHIRNWLRQLITEGENWLYAAEDAAARRRGWQVSRPPSGHGRSYRDPRWDLISVCDSCGGHGGHPAQPCLTCDGHGTLGHRRTNAALRGAR